MGWVKIRYLWLTHFRELLPIIFRKPLRISNLISWKQFRSNLTRNLVISITSDYSNLANFRILKRTNLVQSTSQALLKHRLDNFKIKYLPRKVEQAQKNRKLKLSKQISQTSLKVHKLLIYWAIAWMWKLWKKPVKSKNYLVCNKINRIPYRDKTR